jgi:probable phosphoglycerate mutase
MVNKTLYLIRHGLIRSNIKEVYAGRNEEKLTDSGVERARQIGKEMQDWGIKAIYTSPLARTVQTAQILNEHINAKLILEPDLIEMNLGPWTGLSKYEVTMNYPVEYRTWYERPSAFKMSGIETLDEVLKRVLRFMDKFLNAESEKIAAMVTHAVAVKCAVLHYERLPLDSYHRIDVPNLSVRRLTSNEKGITIERLK